MVKSTAVFREKTFGADMKPSNLISAALLLVVIVDHHATQAFFRFRPPRWPFYARTRTTYARVALSPGGNSGVSGDLVLEQAYPGGPVLIKGTIKGLKQGLHGFHVHTKGELGNDCKDAGSHFNPFMKNHGDPGAADYFSPTASKVKGHHHLLANDERHVGDLGNIFTASNSYPTHVFKLDNVISLQDGHPANIAGRAVVVHADADDLGRGNDDESLKTGNAGSRVACGIIQKL